MPEKPYPKIFYVLGPDIVNSSFVPEIKEAFINSGLKEEDICIVDLSEFVGTAEEATKKVNDEFKKFTAGMKKDETVTFILDQHGGIDNNGNHTTSACITPEWQMATDEEREMIKKCSNALTKDMLVSAEELNKEKGNVNLFIANCFGSNYLNDNKETSFKNVSALGGDQEFAFKSQFNNIVYHLNAGKYKGPLNDETLIKLSLITDSGPATNNSMIRVNGREKRDAVIDMKEKLYDLVHQDSFSKKLIIAKVREELVNDPIDNTKIGLSKVDFYNVSQQILNAKDLMDIEPKWMRKAMLVAYTADKSPNMSISELDNLKEINALLNRDIMKDKAISAVITKKNIGESDGIPFSDVIKKSFEEKQKVLEELKQRLNKLDNVPYNSYRFYDSLVKVKDTDAIKLFLDKGFDVDSEIPMNNDSKNAGTTILLDLAYVNSASTLFAQINGKLDQQDLSARIIKRMPADVFLDNITEFGKENYRACIDRIHDLKNTIACKPELVRDMLCKEMPIPSTTIVLIDEVLKGQVECGRNFVNYGECFEYMAGFGSPTMQEANAEAYLTVLKRNMEADKLDFSFFDDESNRVEGATKGELTFGKEGMEKIKRFIDNDLDRFTKFNQFKATVMNYGRNGFSEDEIKAIKEFGKDFNINATALKDKNDVVTIEMELKPLKLPDHIKLMGVEIKLQELPDESVVPTATAVYSPETRTVKLEKDIIR